MANFPEKPLTGVEREAKLLERLKYKAMELKYGRLTLNIIVHEGRIAEIELTQQTERWRAV